MMASGMHRRPFEGRHLVNSSPWSLASGVYRAKFFKLAQKNCNRCSFVCWLGHAPSVLSANQRQGQWQKKAGLGKSRDSCSNCSIFLLLNLFYFTIQFTIEYFYYLIQCYITLANLEIYIRIVQYFYYLVILIKCYFYC